MVEPLPPIITQVLQEHIMSKPTLSPTGSSNSILGTKTPVNLLARIDDPPAPTPTAAAPPPSHTMEETTSRNRGCIVLKPRSTALPHSAPTLNASDDTYLEALYRTMSGDLPSRQSQRTLQAIPRHH